VLITKDYVLHSTLNVYTARLHNRGIKEVTAPKKNAIILPSLLQL